MLRNLRNAIPLPVCLALMIALFAIVWPVVVLSTIDQNDNTLWTADSQRTVYVWSLWSPEMKARVFVVSFYWMAIIGFFIGIDAALRIKWRSLRLSHRKTRLVFIIVHSLAALTIGAFDFYGLFRQGSTWFTVRQLDYLLLVECLPIMWFVYSWITLRESNARRQRRMESARVQNLSADYKRRSG